MQTPWMQKPPPPVNRMMHRCKNITLPQTGGNQSEVSAPPTRSNFLLKLRGCSDTQIQVAQVCVKNRHTWQVLHALWNEWKNQVSAARVADFSEILCGCLAPPCKSHLLSQLHRGYLRIFTQEFLVFLRCLLYFLPDEKRDLQINFQIMSFYTYSYLKQRLKYVKFIMPLRFSLQMLSDTLQ